MSEAVVTIPPQRLKSIERRHPWVFSGAVKHVEGSPQGGDIVALRSERGDFLARGYWNARSAIRVRLLTWNDESVDTAFWERQMRQAIAVRANQGVTAGSTAYRLIHAENDYLPGLIVDRYGDWLVMQALTLGIETRKHELAEILLGATGAAGVYERSDVDIRQKEGLPPHTGLLVGQEPPEQVEIDENGRRFLVDVRHGHKTGFYLDQRENRAIIGDWLRGDDHAQEREVLNTFAYTGGFAVYALAGLARRVVNVDSSADALALARQNVALNGFAVEDEGFVEGDVFQVMRYYRDMGRTFDMIILDPPKFAQTPQQVDKAARGYKDINLLAFKLLKPGGILATFSCSGAIDESLFQKIVFGALVDAGRDGQILRRLAQGPDHPVALTFPEGAYLKGFLCQVW
ncbi:MAG TPA: class I SAM-dependent rRNA methyltransferase [Aggregatilinea sp.]|uniref:class I SAM-dependent rRNA methyltransferase n=1 Tax=Aggregatilinea sp. TaxID=2806333 RepID=UPI002BB38C0B|nr:class I SAM-dependent rRNA methyltransferase [Aggregatilinea sp.]HML20120.1 class I SAM-dependent rRNA methyltransferase [Aggregatilinea sp.]